MDGYKEEKNMWTKNILKAFNPETEIRYIINGKLIEDITTVKEFMDNGLTTYSTVTEGQLEITDNCIIIRV